MRAFHLSVFAILALPAIGFSADDPTVGVIKQLADRAAGTTNSLNSRLTAIDTLGKLGVKVPPSAQDISQKLQALLQPKAIIGTATPPAAIPSDRPKFRLRVVNALGSLGGSASGSIDAMVAIIGEDDPTVDQAVRDAIDLILKDIPKPTAGDIVPKPSAKPSLSDAINVLVAKNYSSDDIDTLIGYLTDQKADPIAKLVAAKTIGILTLKDPQLTQAVTALKAIDATTDPGLYAVAQASLKLLQPKQ